MQNESRAALLRVGDVSRRLGIHRQTAYLKLKRGDIPSVRVGRAIRVDPQALEAWIQQGGKP
jgi:excisionase family DNA binding protein